MSNRHILIIGAGFVAKPALIVLHDLGYLLTVACIDLGAATCICKGLENATASFLDVTNVAELDAAVAQADLILSLIPYTFHAVVVRSAIRNKKHVVTSSYISPELADLDNAARDTGIVVLNECGLDPGIDHLLAISTIGDVHQLHGRIRSFRSFCGALPSPEYANDPLGYKFSWSPKGVLLALKNTAKYYNNGRIREIAGANLLDSVQHFSKSFGTKALVAYPNRDSSIYRELYEIPEAQNITRNTLRYDGFPQIMKALTKLGFLSEHELKCQGPSSEPIACIEVTRLILGGFAGGFPGTEEDLIHAIESKIACSSSEAKESVIPGMKWLGLLSTELVLQRETALDTLCGILEQKLSYKAGERDMVILQHQFEIEHLDGNVETRNVTLTEFGDPQEVSALAKLVGMTCALAAKNVLNGHISETGVIAPLQGNVARILLGDLKAYGIEAQVDSSFPPKEKDER